MADSRKIDELSNPADFSEIPKPKDVASMSPASPAELDSLANAIEARRSVALQPPKADGKSAEVVSSAQIETALKPGPVDAKILSPETNPDERQRKLLQGLLAGEVDPHSLTKFLTRGDSN